jgi:CubicO group peptidase (beta-lactamase class C family)
MKKVLIGLAIAVTAFGANAQMIRGHGWVGPDHYRHQGHGGSWNWVVPAVVGGAVVYAATRPPVVVQQPVIVQQQPVDVVYIDGIAYKKQIMVINGQYQEVLVRL